MFQLVGGRLLGPELFAPVSVLWTLMFLTGTVALTPVEQYVAREATAGHRVLTRRSSAIVAVIVLTAVAAGTFTAVTNDALFLSERGFIVLGVLIVTASILPSISSNILRKSWYPLAEGHFLILACSGLSSQSHTATTSPRLPAWSMSLEPLPPTPTPAMRRRSLAPQTLDGSRVKAKAEAEVAPRKWRRE